ncbi:MAG TPA: hypothetical protein VFF65_01815 [Phycisphaerales bacterium]|nr:hypothetical protein [Phycisphaerales bacterium]
MWGKLRTLGLVTLVTVLIWVWADAETQRGGGDLLQAVPGPSVADEVEFVVQELPVVTALPAGRPAPQRLTVSHPVLRNVAIIGPRRTIERLQAADGTVTVRAALVLDESDLNAGRVSKSVELVSGAAGLRFAGPVPTVQVVIER